jgi:ATP-binding cassette subfamily B protein
MVNDIATINEYGFGNFSMILSQLFNILLGAYVLLTLHYSLILSILLLTVVMIIVPKFFSKKLNSYMSDFSKANENFTHHLNGLLGGLRTLYSTQSMPYFISKVILASENLAKSKIKFSSYSGVMQSATNGVSLASQIILLFQAGWLYSLGYVVIGSLTATQYLSATIFSSLTGLGANWIEMKTIQEIFDKFSELDESEVIDDDFLPVLENGISVKNVSFAYPGSEQSILNNISINIKKGGKYGLVGQSGSGKTTLLNLLFGIFKPSQGEIYYDDISYKELGSTLFKRVAYVEQEGVLFSGSIIENITLGKDYDENTVKTILKAVDLLEWVEQQTNGLMTVIDWEGKMISGGQKQKIALARALFLEKDIIFLDESVSAIDKISAKRIEQYLLNRDDLTLVFITHHLNPKIENRLDGIISL